MIVLDPVQQCGNVFSANVREYSVAYTWNDVLVNDPLHLSRGAEFVLSHPSLKPLLGYLAQGRLGGLCRGLPGLDAPHSLPC